MNRSHDLRVRSVRSSIARRLGTDIGALAPVDRQVEGVVKMVLDATTRHREPLTHDRLLGWHAALFPTGRSGLAPIRTGALRDDATGPMRVVSGSHGRAKLIERLPDDFESKPTSRKWAAIAKCSPDTAPRDIDALVGLGVLRRGAGGGRSTAYEIVHGEGPGNGMRNDAS